MASKWTKVALTAATAVLLNPVGLLSSAQQVVTSEAPAPPTNVCELIPDHPALALPHSPGICCEAARILLDLVLASKVVAQDRGQPQHRFVIPEGTVDNNEKPIVVTPSHFAERFHTEHVILPLKQLGSVAEQHLVHAAVAEFCPNHGDENTGCGYRIRDALIQKIAEVDELNAKNCGRDDLHPGRCGKGGFAESAGLLRSTKTLLEQVVLVQICFDVHIFSTIEPKLLNGVVTSGWCLRRDRWKSWRDLVPAALILADGGNRDNQNQMQTNNYEVKPPSSAMSTIARAGASAVDTSAPPTSSSKSSASLYLFGIFNGDSVNTLLKTVDPEKFTTHAFDSFEGIPLVDQGEEFLNQQIWDEENRYKATVSVEELRTQFPGVNFVKGWFNETLPGYFNDSSQGTTSRTSASPSSHQLPHKNFQHHKAAFVDIDVDLYSSTQQVLNFLWSNSLINVGTLIGYDDWWFNACSDNDQDDYFWFNPLHSGEGRAHFEFAKSKNIYFRCVGGPCVSPEESPCVKYEDPVRGVLFEVVKIGDGGNDEEALNFDHGFEFGSVENLLKYRTLNTFCIETRETATISGSGKPTLAVGLMPKR
eukprot:g4778.t1